MNLSTDSHRELQTGLLGANAWKVMCAMAVFTANKVDADAHWLKPKPLSAEARAIVGELPALAQPQEGDAVAMDLDGDLEEEVQTGGGEQDAPVVPGGGLKGYTCSATKRATDEGGRSTGTTGKGSSEMKAASSAEGGGKRGATG